MEESGVTHARSKADCKQAKVNLLIIINGRLRLIIFTFLFQQTHNV
jgi:hypothetical protein